MSDPNIALAHTTVAKEVLDGSTHHIVLELQSRLNKLIADRCGAEGYVIEYSPLRLQDADGIPYVIASMFARAVWQ